MIDVLLIISHITLKHGYYTYMIYALIRASFLIALDILCLNIKLLLQFYDVYEIVLYKINKHTMFGWIIKPRPLHPHSTWCITVIKNRLTLLCSCCIASLLVIEYLHVEQLILNCFWETNNYRCQNNYVVRSNTCACLIEHTNCMHYMIMI